MRVGSKVSTIVVVLVVAIVAQSAAWNIHVVRTGPGWRVTVDEEKASRVVYSEQELLNKPSVVRVAPDIYEVLISCGNPCSYTRFVDTVTGQISDPFFLVVHYATRTKSVFYVDKAGELASKRLFSNAPVRTYELPNVAPVAVIALAVEQVKVRTDGAVQVTYLSGNNFSERVAVFK